jgi:hypothetical protein
MTHTQNMNLNYKAWLILIIIGLIIALLQSCRPSLQTCNQLYPPHVIEKIKDSISYKKEYIQLKGDSTYIALPFDCKEDSLRRAIELYKGKAGNYETRITWLNGKLTVTQQRFDDSVAVWNKYQQKSDIQIQKVPFEVEKKVVPKWCWILCIVIVSYIGLKFSPIKRFIP